MSSNNANQKNQQLHYSPLPPPFKSKFSLIHRDSKIKSFLKVITILYNYDRPKLNTNCKNMNLTFSKLFSDSFKFALYHPKFNN